MSRLMRCCAVAVSRSTCREAASCMLKLTHEPGQAIGAPPTVQPVSGSFAQLAHVVVRQNALVCAGQASASVESEATTASRRELHSTRIVEPPLLLQRG